MGANTDLPAGQALNVTPADGVILDFTYTRGVYIGGAGDLTVVMNGNGETVTFAGLQAGTLLPIVVKSINATGTSATGIVALR